MIDQALNVSGREILQTYRGKITQNPYKDSFTKILPKNRQKNELILKLP